MRPNLEAVLYQTGRHPDHTVGSYNEVYQKGIRIHSLYRGPLRVSVSNFSRTDAEGKTLRDCLDLDRHIDIHQLFPRAMIRRTVELEFLTCTHGMPRSTSLLVFHLSSNPLVAHFVS